MNPLTHSKAAIRPFLMVSLLLTQVFFPCLAAHAQASNNKLTLQFVTGGDDLRGGNDNVNVLLLLQSGTPPRFDNVNGRFRWPDHSSKTVILPLPDTVVRFEDIKGIRLETTFGGGLGGDNWNLDRLAASATIGGVTQQLFDQRGTPLFRFTGDQHVREFQIATNNELILQFVTGGDDLRGGRDNRVNVSLLLRPGFPLPLRFENVNSWNRWPDHSSQTVNLGLPATLRFEDIKGVRIETTFGGGLGGDNWNLDRLTVSARIGGVTQQLFDQSGTPLFRFTGDQRVFQMGSYNELILHFVTGGDDLRGGNDNVHVSLLLQSGLPLRFENVNGRKRWPDHSSQTVNLPLPDTVRFEDIKGVQLETTFGGPGRLGGDNWNLDRLTASAKIGGVTQQLFDQSGTPLFRFTGDVSVRAFPQFSGTPYDLTWKDVDLNGLPLNPRWATQDDPVNPSLPGLSVCNTPWQEPCTTQSPTIVDLPWHPGNIFEPISQFCEASGPLGRHVNWGVVTYEGSSAETKRHSDSDYSINLARDDRAACTLDNPTRIHTEFDSNETINDFQGFPWWDSLRQTVNDKGSALLRSDGAEVEVIEVGVIGLDCGHNCGSEIHPVLALAIHTQDNPSDDQWAIFAMNWGGEGFCSHDTIFAPELSTVFLKLPWRSGATAVTANEATTKWVKNHERIQVQTFPLVSEIRPTPSTPPAGFVVQVDLGTPTDGPVMHGELHLQWTMEPDRAVERRDHRAGRRPPVAGDDRTVERRDHRAGRRPPVADVFGTRPDVASDVATTRPEPEDRFAEYVAGLPTNIRTQYEQVKSAYKPDARRWMPVKATNLPRPPTNFQSRGVRRNVRPGRIEIVPNKRKQEFYEKLGEILAERSSSPPR
jgi:hypothetical protein